LSSLPDQTSRVGGAAASGSRELLVYQHPDEFPSDVEALFALGEATSCELGAAWYRNYLKAVTKPGDTVCFHVLRRNGQAVAAIPVQAKADRLPWHRRVEALGNYYTALYAPVVHSGIGAAELVPLLEAIKQTYSPMASLTLQPMDPKSHAYEVVLRAMQMAGLFAFEFHCFGNWFLRDHGNWASYLAQLTSKMRSNIKRMEKKLSQDEGTVEIMSTAADRDRAIAAYGAVYSASWKHDEPYPDFMPGLIATCAERGWMRLGVVWLRGQPIAAQLWMVAHRKAEIYKVAYDEAFKDYSPGTVLTAALLQHVMQQDAVDEIDYLVGDDSYKKNWMNERRTRSGIVAYNPKNIGGLFGLLREGLGRAIKLIRLRVRSLRSPKEAVADAP
jgi:Acetyltransferase (GNAT) domain